MKNGAVILVVEGRMVEKPEIAGERAKRVCKT
jgi:hypothetical protein